MSYQIPKPVGAPLKSNVLEILKTKAVKLKAHKSYDSEQGLVPDQILDQKKERDELKLLEQQLRYKEGVNGFLVRKYTDGSAIGVPKENQYDNSPARLAAGISFEYHVYYPQNPNDVFPLADHRHVVTPKLVDNKTGDHYYYHFPIRKYIHNNVGVYKIDYSNELVSLAGIAIAPPDYQNNDNRLFYALGVLANNIVNQHPVLDRYSHGVLKSNKFLGEDGKLHLDVQTDVMVEKFFLKMNPDLKPKAMEYLSKEFGQPAAVAPAAEAAPAPAAPKAAPKAAPAPAAQDDDEELEELRKHAAKKDDAFHHALDLLPPVVRQLVDGMDLKEKIEVWKQHGVNVYSVTQNGGKPSATTYGPVYIGFGTNGIAAVTLSKLWFGMRGAQLANIILQNNTTLKRSIRRPHTVVESREYIARLEHYGLSPILNRGNAPDNLLETLKVDGFTINKL